MGNDQPKKERGISPGTEDATLPIFHPCNIFCFQELTMINVLENIQLYKDLYLKLKMEIKF